MSFREDHNNTDHAIKILKGDVITIPQMSKELNICYYRLWHKVNSGDILSFRNEAKIEIPVSEMERFKVNHPEMIDMDIGKMQQEDEVTVSKAAEILNKNLTDVIELTVTGKLSSRKATLNEERTLFSTVVPLQELKG